MRQYFNSEDAAKRNLAIRRKLAYERIEKKGWKILGDGSFVQPVHKWANKRTESGKFYNVATKRIVWHVNLMIVTDELMKDLKAMQSFDSVAEMEKHLVEEFSKKDNNI